MGFLKGATNLRGEYSGSEVEREVGARRRLEPFIGSPAGCPHSHANDNKSGVVCGNYGIN